MNGREHWPILCVLAAAIAADVLLFIVVLRLS